MKQTEHIIFEKFPILEIDELVLREIDVNDTPAFFNYINHKDVSRFLSSEDIPETLSKAQEELMYWQRLFRYKHSIYWAVVNRSDNKMIGTCGFNNWSRTHKRSEISYDLSFDYWNKGIMTKVVKLICQFALEQMKVQRIQATVAQDNASSIRLLEKAGFEYEGCLRDYGILHQQTKNFLMYSLIKT